MFGTVDLVVGGNVHVQDHTLRPPNIPAEYAAFDPVFVRVTYANEAITELRSIFGVRDGKIWVLAEEKWDRPPQGMIEVQQYFTESGAGLGVIYFPASMMPTERAEYGGTGKWTWGLSHQEPLAAGTFTYSTLLNASVDRLLTLQESYDAPKFHRRYTFKNGMETLTDLGQPTIAGVIYFPNDNSCPDNTVCPPFPGFWVELNDVREADESRCLSVLKKDKPPGPPNPGNVGVGWREYPIPVTLCKVNRAVWKADGTIMALKP